MIARIQSLARNVLHRSRVERALDDELHGYLDELAADFRRRGMSDAEARRAARLELRGLDVVKESVRDVWLGRRLDTLRRDVQYSLRALRNRPGFTATAVLTLALGLGGATAVFSVINAVMFRPPPGIADPSRVVAIDRVINGATFDGLSFPALLELRAGTHAYAGIAAHVGTPLRLQRADGSRTNIIVDFATGNYFRVLGVRASLGRLLAPADAEVHDPRPLLVLN
ncbi:MAG: permease prefix domain 1-containing protein, partial [Gemmatimonadaceae bacterium]